MSDRPTRADRASWQPGPTGRAPTTESVGDPHADDPAAATHEGAAAGGIAGAVVGGPLGMAAGAAIGGAIGAAGEAADADGERGYERSAEGTGPVDPLYDQPPDNRDGDDR